MRYVFGTGDIFLCTLDYGLYMIYIYVRILEMDGTYLTKFFISKF